MCIFLFKFNCAWFIWFGFAHQEDNTTPSSKLKNPIKIGKLHFYGIFGEMYLMSSQSLLDNTYRNQKHLSILIFITINSTIFNIARWVIGSLGLTTDQPSV